MQVSTEKNVLEHKGPTEVNDPETAKDVSEL